MNRLNGKVAVITGGTSGIGAATAKLFQAEGAAVIATGSSAETVEAAQRETPGIDFVTSEAGSVEAAKSLVEHARAKHGRIDVLFVNAGTSRITPFEAVDQDSFDELFNLLFRGPYFLIQQATPLMPQGGSIVLTGSTAAIQAFPGTSVYTSAKAALRALGLSLGLELAPRGIRVNTVVPGPIATNIGAKMNLTADQMAGFGAMIGRVPLARIGQPDEVAKAVLYFASDESMFTTGAELRVDGGLTVT